MCTRHTGELSTQLWGEPVLSVMVASIHRLWMVGKEVFNPSTDGGEGSYFTNQYIRDDCGEGGRAFQDNFLGIQNGSMKSGGLFGAWAHSCRSKLRGRQFLMYWDTSLSRHFMTTDISAIGLYSFRLLMACLSGTGIGNMSRKDWKDWIKPLIVGEHKLQPLC